VVTLLCDGGDRYTGSIYDDTWVAEHQFDLGPPMDTLRRAVARGRWQE
jgi:cysteine synthase A